MGAKSPENNSTMYNKENNSTNIQNNIICPTKGTSISKSPKGQDITSYSKKNSNDIKKETKTVFERLTENPELNKTLKEVIFGMSFYIDGKLGHNFNKIEKDNIKTVLINYMLEKVDNVNLKIIEGIKVNLKEKLKAFTKSGDKTKKENFESIFRQMQINGLQEDLDKKIEEIKSEKNQKDFSNLAKTFDSIDIDKPTGDIFKSIKDNLDETSKKFDKFSKMGKDIKKAADKLGMGDLKELMEYLKKEFPILGMIISMFLGGLETNGNSEKDKSISNLQNFIDDKNKSPLNKIEKNKNYKDKEKLNSEKLKPFYEYLDSEWIKYGEEKSEFWKEFLTGLPKDGNNKINIEIEKIRKLFLEELNGKKLENLDITDLIKNLNKLPEIAKQKEEEIENNNKRVEAQIEKAKDSGTTKEVLKLEKQLKYSFKKNLLRGKVKINGELKNISIENNNIKIGDDLYSIKIIGTGLLSLAGDVFESIKLDNGQLTVIAHGETVNYPIEKAVPLLKELINNGGITNKLIKGKHATLTITKNNK